MSIIGGGWDLGVGLSVTWNKIDHFHKYFHFSDGKNPVPVTLLVLLESRSWSSTKSNFCGLLVKSESKQLRTETRM